MFNFARLSAQPIQELKEFGVDWERLRQSLAEITAAYPDDWNRNAERAMACLVGTEIDYDAALRRSAHSLQSAAWFDSGQDWPSCEQRQRESTAPLLWLAVNALKQVVTSPYALAAALAGLVFALIAKRRSRA